LSLTASGSHAANAARSSSYSSFATCTDCAHQNAESMSARRDGLPEERHSGGVTLSSVGLALGAHDEHTHATAARR
jgi:hypothetical protein